jgi:hypothetical protein
MKLSGIGRIAACLALLVLGSLAVAKPPESGYHLLKKYTFGTAPGGVEYFDYITVDSSARRVYLSHGTEVQVIDADNGTLIGNMTVVKQDAPLKAGFQGTHAIALVNELGKGFITDSDDAKVVIFNIASLKVTGEIKTQFDADCVIYDPASKRIFSFNGDPHNVTVIDPAKETVVKTLPLGGSPEFAVADGKGTVYDSLNSANEIVAIDSRTLEIKSRWPVAPSGHPTSIAMDREHRRLFSAGRNPQILVIMDADNGKVIQSFPISSTVDASVYEPETSLLFVSTKEGMLHIFHEDSPDKFSVVETVKTEFGAKTMGLDTKTHNLFLDTSDFGPPPAPTPAHPHPDPVQDRQRITGSFHVLVYGR